MGQVHTGGTSQAQRSITFGEDDGLVVEFFERFGNALTKADMPALLSMWETPVLALGDDIERLLSTRADVVTFFSGMKDAYKERGVLDTRPDIERIEWATDKIIIVDVRWPYLDENGSEFGEERSTYVLRLDDAGKPRLRVAVMRGPSAN